MHIGDLLLVTPILRTLRTNFPNAHIALLADAKLADLVKHNSNISELIAIDKKGHHDKLINYLQFIGEIRQRKFDLVINLHKNERASFIAALSGAKKIVGYSTFGANLLFDQVIENRKLIKHQVRAHFDVLRETLGITTVDDRGLEMWLDERAEATAETIWQQAFPTCLAQIQTDCRASLAMTDDITSLSLRGGTTKQSIPVASTLPDMSMNSFPIIGLNIGASWPTKRWPKEYFAELADRLIDKGYGIAYFGGSMDIEIVDQAIRLMEHRNHPQVVKLTGKVTLMELAALIKKCRVFVTNDSGPMHIAVAMNVPLVSMFGASPVEGFRPYNDRSVVLKPPLPCHPCHKHSCDLGGLQCMYDITVEEVLEATRKQVSKYGNMEESNEQSLCN